MKHIVPALFAIGAMTTASASAQECINADPASVLATVKGDFEITVDPQDPAQNLIFIANLADGMSKVVGARIDGETGQVMPGSPATIAGNFYGLGAVNGPEFVRKPTGELGVLYAGVAGVSAIFRSATPATWSAFDLDASGNHTVGDAPPPLASTSPGAYPAAQELGQNTYSEFRGDCQSMCYGALGQGTTTDIATALAPRGLVPTRSAQSPIDGYIYIAACNLLSSCSLYGAQIDGAGGFVPRSFQKLVSLGQIAPNQMVAARHPLTGTTVVFSNNDSSAIDVWEQAEPGAPLKLLKRVPASEATHFRTLTDGNEIVLNYLVRSGANAGSYTIPIGAAANGLVVGAGKKVSKHGSGTELVWLPAADKWAVFFRSFTGGLQRCWITP